MRIKLSSVAVCCKSAISSFFLNVRPELWSNKVFIVTVYAHGAPVGERQVGRSAVAELVHGVSEDLLLVLQRGRTSPYKL